MTDSVTEKIFTPDTPTESVRSFIAYGVVAVGLALCIRFFIAAPFIVSGSSMEHTFENLDYLIVDRLSYDFSTPERGDVVVFGLPSEPSRDLIKRVVGLPGETIQLTGSAPEVTIFNAEHPEGIQLDQPFLIPANYGGSTDRKITLGADEYFVLGDNRRVSSDSRSWGPLPRKRIVGRVLVRLFPFNQVTMFPGKVAFSL